MKLLIIAGPYEADLIRRAAVSAGFEAVAVEPGESLSGWITATRPDVIVMAPQIVNGDPQAALAKVRSVPRGRVPILLVGDPGDRAHLLPLADGFVARPVATDELLAQARAAMARAVPRAADDPISGPQASPLSGSGDSGRVGTPVGAAALKSGGSGKGPTLKPLVAAREPDARPNDDDVRVAPPPTVTVPARPGLPATMVVPPTTAALQSTGKRLPPPRLGHAAPTMFDGLAQTIDADFDAELMDVVRAVGVLRQDRVGGQPAEGAAVSGDEVDLDLPSLLARMYLSRLSGRLTLKHGDARMHIVFERGHPVLAGSTRSEDRMGEMLIRQGRFTRAQIAACGVEVASSGRRMGAVLVDRGMVKATELSGLVRRHYEDVIYSLFAWERATWNLGTDGSAAAEKVLLSRHPTALVLEGIRRKYGAGRAVAGLGGTDRVLRLRLTTGASDLLEKMELTPEERNLVLLFDGVRTLDEIRRLTGAPPERLYGVAWALTVLERLDVVDPAVGHHHSGESLAVDDAANAQARDAVIDRALVRSRHALVVEGDYFQILGVSRDCSSQEIQRAHEVLRLAVSAEALHPSIVAEWDTELGEIRDVLDEAARLLGDEHLRVQYRDHLAAPAPAPVIEERAP